MSIRSARVHAAAASLLIALSSSAAANMVANPSYETGPPVPAGMTQVGVGSTAIDGGVVTQAPINYVGDAYWEAAQGVRSLALNAGSTPGGIAQTFASIPGIAYKVDFKMSGEAFTFPVLKVMRVSAAGQSADFTFDSSNAWHWDMLWSQRSWSFTANAASTTVEFTSLMTAAAAPLLDDVVVGLVTTDVPRPTDAFPLALSAPSPAAGHATFACTLPVAGPATLRVTDVLGRTVATLVDGVLPAGQSFQRWNAAGAPPGVYVVTLRAAGGELSRRFALLR